MSSKSSQISSKLDSELGKSDVWSVFSPASGHVPKDSVNLGQGFMDWMPPEFLRNALMEAVQDPTANQYSIPKGRLRLRKALSDFYSPHFNLPNSRALNADTEILVTAGANEGMYAFLLAFLQPNDEVIMFSPHFDQYVPNVTFSGGKPVFLPLVPPKQSSESICSSADWKVDFDALKAACNKKTKVIILNTPHNPVGKVFTKEELLQIGEIAEEHDILILADEVYDQITLSRDHVRIASLSEKLWKRTVTVGSAGKSFSCTGWRVGYLIGPEELITPTLAATTRIVFCVNSPAQEAVAVGIEKSEEAKFFPEQRDYYAKLLDRIREPLDELGLPYTVPEGSYFVLISTDKLEIPKDFVVPDMIKNRPKDWHAAWFVAQTCGVVLIPPSEFYPPELQHIGERYLRLAFCKTEGTLDEAGKRLLKLKPYVKH